MMADDTQDDLSMEDILSSIKDILDKDTQPQNVADLDALEPEVVVSASENTPEDEPEEDVYDLSKTMIIDDQFIQDTNSDSEKDEDLDLDFDDIDTNLDDIDVGDFDSEDISEVVAEEPALDSQADPIEDFEFEIAASNEQEDDFSDKDPLFEVSDTDADPIFSEDISNDTTLDELFADSASTEEKSIFAETVELSIPTNDDAIIVENIDDILNSASKVIYADTSKEEKKPIEEAIIAQSPVINEEKPLVAESLVVTEEPVIIQSPVLVEESKISENTSFAQEDATDVSANIISNFAKMFADKKEVAPEEVPMPLPIANYAEINELGNGSQTISEVVEGVIKNIISASVSAELNSKVDIAAYAKAEIKAQTQAWLEANLTTIVEAAVQKEIERVMAKVGQ